MIEQLLLHAVGDYITQNSWMALNKKNKGLNGFHACYVHCTLYSIPFFFIGSPLAVGAIFLSHFIIDRTHVVEHWVAFYNRGKADVNFGYPPERPLFLTLWLYIIVDNTFHLLCNYAALRWL